MHAQCTSVQGKKREKKTNDFIELKSENSRNVKITKATNLYGSDTTECSGIPSFSRTRNISVHRELILISGISALFCVQVRNLNRYLIRFGVNVEFCIFNNIRKIAALL